MNLVDINKQLAEILGLPSRATKCVLTLEVGKPPSIVVTSVPTPSQKVVQRFTLVPEVPADRADVDVLEQQADPSTGPAT